MKEPRSFTDAQAARLSKLYAQADTEITHQLQIYITAGRAPGTARNLKILLSNVRQIRVDLLNGARTWTQTSIPATYKKGIDYADLGIPADMPVQAGFFGIHQQAVNQLASELYGRLNEVDGTIDGSVRTIARQVDDIYRARTLEASRAPVMGYKTSTQAVKELEKDLRERGITGFIDKSGREWTLESYSRMAAITTTNNTLREGTKNRIVERGQDLVIISIHENPCEICEQFQGETFSISGTDEEYPPLQDAEDEGLFHPYCKHTMSLAPAAKERWLNVLQGGNGEEARNAEIGRLIAAYDQEHGG